MWSYWAAISGNGGLVGLQQQLHPKVHDVLFWIFHFWQFSKLSVQDERLHDGGHKPGRRHTDQHGHDAEPGRSGPINP